MNLTCVLQPKSAIFDPGYMLELPAQRGFVHLDFNHSDGHVSHTSIDLNLYIGNVNGRLQWDATGFSKTCKSIHLEEFFLVADCLVPTQHGQKEHYVTTHLDLRTHFRIAGEILIYIKTNKKLSMMLSEVPWMKSKVITEPDLSVFSSHLVVFLFSCELNAKGYV